MVLCLPFFHLQKRLWERQEEGREAARALTGALAWITRDLEQAGYHVPGPALRRLEPAAIAYVLSRDEEDPAAFAPANRRLVTAYLDGDELKYRIQAPLAPPATGWESGSVQVLAAGIAGMSCRGVGRDGDPATTAESAALVACELAAANGATTATLVRLRSRGAGAP
jgi:hypothetical protein